MEKFVIKGQQRLKGSVRISGAKNAALPIMVASILSAKPVILKNIPLCQDVFTMKEILEELGVKIKHREDTLFIDARDLKEGFSLPTLTQKLRYSLLFIGAYLAKFGQLRIPSFGGCALGPRPIDIHIDAMRRLGARLKKRSNLLYLDTEGLKGNKVLLRLPSVTATQNTILAATLAEGITIIKNAAKEPEVVDMANFLNSIGAKIKGAGTSTIIMEGVSSLLGGEYSVIPDRIETATFLFASVATNSEISIEHTLPGHLRSLLDMLKRNGARILQEKSRIIVKPHHKIKPFRIRTKPYPGFPTDLQPFITALALGVNGKSVIEEDVYRFRFNHIPELKKMGAKIKLDNVRIIIRGPQRLHGAKTKACDLRTGASLIIAALSAESETTISQIYQIDRGYENIEKKLSALGADIKRAPHPENPQACL